MRSRFIAVTLAVLSSAPAFALADNALPPLTSDKPFKRLFTGPDPRQLPTIVKAPSQRVVADCGALKRADPRHDARMRVPPPDRPESSSRSVVPPPCRQ